MLGNFIFGVTALIVIGFIILSAQDSNNGSDSAMGHALAYMFMASMFIISSLILTLYVGWKGGFDWVSDQSKTRNVIVGIGWLCMTITTVSGLTWMPLLMLVPYFFLLSPELRASVSPIVYKIPLTIAFGLMVFMTLGLLYGLAKPSVERRIYMFKMRNVREAKSQSDYNATLEFINTYNEATITGLLKFVNSEDKQHRNAAIAKIKSFENWENDLIGILTQKDREINYVYNDNSNYVYAFLEDNKIEHPEKFIQPIISNLKVLTMRAEDDLDDPYARELWDLNIKGMCRVLETQFKNSATEFRPSLLKLQKVLEVTPAERKYKWYLRILYMRELKTSRLAVKNWLNSNQ